MKNYSAPTLVSLRLEKRVAEDAAKWWKVEDWAKQRVSGQESADHAYALREFIVTLMKG
jgi:hypothetical protein